MDKKVLVGHNDRAFDIIIELVNSGYYRNRSYAWFQLFSFFRKAA